MALSSSRALITISFFLSILAGQAVRDLPKSNNITDINVSTEKLGLFVLVATVYPNKYSSWESNCFKQNRGLLRYSKRKTIAFLDIEISDATTSSSCSDIYEFRSNTKLLGQATIPGGPETYHFQLPIYYYPEMQHDLDTYGVSVLLSKGEGCDQKKESVLHIVKEVEETMEIF